ncbi:DUF4437 domain-containing protein [Nonomuraea cavernae]|uniref:DUF4437 domain-containing protein n=1 Tax=Nonomuraea cavernae TaxID=2045107 RepID=UPI0033FB55C1
MRPHVELIDSADLIWHPVELPHSEGQLGKVLQRNLSYDEENGAASTRVIFEEAWERPAGYHHADTEWYVLEGEVLVGDQVLRKGGYFRAPAGLAVPRMAAKAGTEALVFREYGDFGFSRSEKNRTKYVPQGGNTATDKPGFLTCVQEKDIAWQRNIYEGDSQRFLHVKFLYRDPSPEDDHTKGFVSLISYAPPNWTDHKVAHHPVFEEAYTIYGDMDYNYGHITPGTYFFRPAKVKHGAFHAGPDKGTMWFFRLDGDLVNWVTEHPEVKVHGVPKNYDPDNPAQRPEIAGLPVRSRSIGPWDGAGR